MQGELHDILNLFINEQYYGDQAAQRQRERKEIKLNKKMKWYYVLGGGGNW